MVRLPSLAAVLVAVASLAALAAPAEPSLGLDLSDSATLKGVLVLPPVTTVVVGKKGAFAGLDTRKTVERFDAPAHEKLVRSFDPELTGKVLPADVADELIKKLKVGPGEIDTEAELAKLADAAHVEWVLGFTLSKTNLLTARIYDPKGKLQGEPIVIADVKPGLTDAQARSCASQVVPRLLALEKERAAKAAKDKPVVQAPPPETLPPPEDDIVDTELQKLEQKRDTGWHPDPDRVRFLVAVGPGAALRDFRTARETANGLATLNNGTVPGIAVTAQLFPLEFFDASGGKAWSQLSLEANYRRSFVSATSSTGEACSMTDDDLQLRAGWRYRFGSGDSMLPTIGIAGGWSQEQTQFACNLPLVSTQWRGVDAQLRLRQPLFKSIVTLELIGGPRVILPGEFAKSPGFSVSAEAWLEVKPVSVLFARAGGRFSRLQAANPDLIAVDTRTFLAVELGAFF